MEKNFDVVKGHFRGEAKHKLAEGAESEQQADELGSCAELENAEKDASDSDIEEPEKDDTFGNEIFEKQRLKLDQRAFEIRKQKRINITVHVSLTFIL